MEQGDIVKAHCNLCAGQRNHLIVHLHKTTWSEEIAEGVHIHGGDSYELLQCAGCESVTLRHSSFHSEVTDEDGRVVPTVTYYPPPTFRRPPKWLPLSWLDPATCPALLTPRASLFAPPSVPRSRMTPPLPGVPS